ncbi:MAG: transposase [Lachnospiraceae bacterium]|nr:transposase [Lachnospiraceae bacterium]
METEKGFLYTYKFQLRPTAIQKNFLNMHFGCCRKLYNEILGETLPIYRAEKDRWKNWKKADDEIKEESKNDKALEEKLRIERKIPKKYDEYLTVNNIERPPYLGNKFSYNGQKKGGYTSVSEYREKYEYLKEIDATALNYVVDNVASAYKACMNSNTNAKEPRFKKRWDKQSYSTTRMINKGNDKYDLMVGNIKLDKENASILLPKFNKEWNGEKVGWIKINLYRDIFFDNNRFYISSVTLSKTPTDEYYISMLCYYEKNPIKQIEKANKVCGVSFGIVNNVVTTSDEKRYYKPDTKKLARIDNHIRKLQEELKNKQKPHFDKETDQYVKGSKNYDKLQKRIKKLQEKRKNILDYNTHCISKSLINEYDKLYVRDFDTKEFMRQRKAEDGKVANETNSDYIRMTADANIGKITEQLKYKSEMYDREIHLINKFYPCSKICCKCGSPIKNYDSKDKYVACSNPNCNAIIERQLNSAKNILKEGESILDNYKSYEDYEKERKKAKKDAVESIVKLQYKIIQLKINYNQNATNPIIINDNKIYSLASKIIHEGKNFTDDEIIEQLQQLVSTNRRNRPHSKTGLKKKKEKDIM